MDNTKNMRVYIPDMGELNDLLRKIDWFLYKSDLEASLANERLWELGCTDEYNPHTENIVRIEEELELLEAGEFEELVKIHDAEYFNDYLED